MIGNRPSKPGENTGFVTGIKTNNLVSGSSSNSNKNQGQINYQNFSSKVSNNEQFNVKGKNVDMSNFTVSQTSHLKTNLNQNFVKVNTNKIGEVPDKSSSSNAGYGTKFQPKFMTKDK